MFLIWDFIREGEAVAKKRTTLMLNATVLALGVAGYSLPAGAAGLGKLSVLSGLGQPLQAEVELTATREELSSLKVRLASYEAFRRANIEFSSALAGINFSIAQRPDGRSVVRMTSSRAVNEPFLDLLVELEWSAGRLVREYTFLLDPPTTPRPRQVVQPVAIPETRAASSPTAVAPHSATPMQATGTREVKRGETLHRIATETRYDGVTIDQMLLAIFRANKDAFDGNMNRLRAGAILTIPSREAVTAVAGSDAKRVVVAQSSDYNAYRERLAGAVAAAPAGKESAPARTASGKIAAKVEEQAPAPAQAKDQLKVSKAESVSGDSGGRSDRAAQARITALEEDLVAKERSLKDSQSRISELEKNISDLQKLMELKNQNLAELQKQAASKPESAAPIAEKPQPAVGAPSEPQPAAAAAPKPAEPVPTQAVPPVPPAAAAKPVSPPPPEPGFLDTLLDNPLFLALGGGVLLAGLGFVGFRMRQRRSDNFSALPTTTTTPSIQPQSVFGATGGQSVDTSASSIQTDFSQSGLTAIDSDEGVDPVAEADVYMAYGRDAQAEEILLDALKNEPTRHAIHVKLLEIYAQRKSIKQFETLASELYAQTGGAGSDWEKAAAIGRKVDPTNPLFGGAASPDTTQVSPAERTVVAASSEALRDTWTMPGELGQIAAQVQGGSGDGASEDRRPASSADATTVVLPESPLAKGGSGNAGPDGAQAGAATPAKESLVDDSAPLDFDLGLDFGSGASSSGSSHSSGEETLILDPAMANRALGTVDVSLDDLSGSPADAGGGSIDLDIGQPGASALEQSDGDLSLDVESTDVRGNVIDIEFDKPPASDAPSETGMQDTQVVDLEHTDIGANVLRVADGDGSSPDEDKVLDLEKTDYDGRVLDFNFKLDDRPSDLPPSDVATTILPVAEQHAAQEMDLSGIDLDLGAEGQSGAAPESGSDLGGDPEVATKLELALAYEEMGDKEGARELLEEVAKEGSDSQQQRARELLDRLV